MYFDLVTDDVIQLAEGNLPYGKTCLAKFACAVCAPVATGSTEYIDWGTVSSSHHPQSFGHSFLQPDIAIFKQNLNTLETLNSKHKLYSKVNNTSLKSDHKHTSLSFCSPPYPTFHLSSSSPPLPSPPLPSPPPAPVPEQHPLPLLTAPPPSPHPQVPRPAARRDLPERVQHGSRRLPHLLPPVPPQVPHQCGGSHLRATDRAQQELQTRGSEHLEPHYSNHGFHFTVLSRLIISSMLICLHDHQDYILNMNNSVYIFSEYCWQQLL